MINVQNVGRLFGVLVLLSCFNPARADEAILSVSGGVIERFLYPPDQAYRIWESLTLTVKLENGAEVSRVNGVIQHPYGEGRYDLSVASLAVVIGSSFTYVDDTIHFELLLEPFRIGSTFELFSLRPEPEGEEPYSLGREGAFSGSYPYRLDWMDVSVVGLDGNPVPLTLKTDPVLTLTDVGRILQVRPVGFEAPVESVSLFAMNEVELYPPRRFERDGNLFGFASFLVGVSENPLPLVFEVILENGAKYYLPYDNLDLQQGVIEIRPNSAVLGWYGYD